MSRYVNVTQSQQDLTAREAQESSRIAAEFNRLLHDSVSRSVAEMNDTSREARRARENRRLRALKDPEIRRLSAL